jgi:hypothetical protein
MLEVALLSFAAILVAWVFAPDASRAPAPAPEPKISASAVPARA